MSARVLLEGLPGVTSVIVGDDDGYLADIAGQSADAENVASSVAVVVRALEPIGDALGLGPCNFLIVKGRDVVRVVGRQRGAIAVVTVEAKRPTTEIEARLRSLAWAPAGPRAAPSRSAPTVAAASPPVVKPDDSDLRSAVFAGDLQLFGLPDLLEFLRAGQRTGTLACSSGAGSGFVYLRRGKVIGASSPTAPSLSAYFSGQGLISEEDIRTLAAHSGNFSDAAVARKLLDDGRLLPDQVKDALLIGTEDAIRELVTWDKGRFEFDPASSIDSPIPGIDLEVDSQTILLDIFRKEDERSRLQ